MSMRQIYCVYEHWRLDTNVCFYVGKGSIHRANQISPKTRNKYHTNIIEKLARTGHLYEVRLVKTGLFEEDAFKLERERIKFWRLEGFKLSNMTDGGEGTSGYIPTDEAKTKISIAHLGKILSVEHKTKISASQKGKKYTLGKHLSEEHKMKISVVHTGKIVSPETKAKMSLALKGRPRPNLLGRKVSDETKAKMSASQKGKPRGPLSEEHKRKLSEASKGNKHALGKTLSEETKAKMSASRKGKIRGPMTLEQKIKISESLKKRNAQLVEINL